MSAGSSTAEIDAAREEIGRRNRAKQDDERRTERERRAAEAREGVVFWRTVLKGPGCWDWAGEVTPSGYGRMRWRGRREHAARIAFRLVNGPIVGGEVRHRCGNPTCVRPDHLVCRGGEDMRAPEASTATVRASAPAACTRPARPLRGAPQAVSPRGKP